MMEKIVENEGKLYLDGMFIGTAEIGNITYNTEMLEEPLGLNQGIVGHSFSGSFQIADIYTDELREELEKLAKVIAAAGKANQLMQPGELRELMVPMKRNKKGKPMKPWQKSNFYE